MEPSAIAARLVEVPGVVAVTLGGSRARGEHSPGSDVDLGLYYRPPLDVAALQALADELSEVPAAVTAPGGWGPWVDGGAWTRIGGRAVDWIHRDLDRVRRSCDDARAGRFEWHHQAGHPLGFPGTTYAGELFHAVVLADPTGELGRTRPAGFPPALRAAVVDRLWEAEFLLGGAAKAAPRGDGAYVAGCLFRALLLCVHALHADAGRWVLNEKGAVAATARLPRAPAGFAGRCAALFAATGSTPQELAGTLARARDLLDQTRAALSEDRPQGQR
ncbi:nucleotidyltransferase family protein [Kineococcus sp. SYSU DK002]|uniref:nucleotidyltransferase family protein n=1 Tax=Kineococcus sp. SYSU DK002 TaxID=3383123 RepID=UPI003D7CD6FA